MPPRCSCGTTLSESPSVGEKVRHARRHKQWAQGIPLPPRLPDPGDVLIVPGNARVSLRMLAYRMARVSQRAGGHLFVSFQYPTRRAADWEQWGVKAYLAVRERTMVGYLVSRLKWSWTDFDLATPEVLFDTSPHLERKAAVDMVFVCANFRRQGIATSLVRAMAADHGVTPRELVWQTPFNPEGLALVRSFSPDGKILVA